MQLKKGGSYMFLNEMQLKAYYEMKREEMERAVLNSKYSRTNGMERLYREFFYKPNPKNTQNNLTETPYCCNITTQPMCCDN